jgi:hypothetical protein
VGADLLQRIRAESHVCSDGTEWVACGFADALAAEQNAYDFSVIQYGKERDLTEFKNEVVVVVNVASE